LHEKEIHDFRIKAQRKLDSGKLLYENGYYSVSTHFFYAMLLTAKALLLKKIMKQENKKEYSMDLINTLFIKKVLI